MDEEAATPPSESEPVSVRPPAATAETSSATTLLPPSAGFVSELVSISPPPVILSVEPAVREVMPSNLPPARTLPPEPEPEPVLVTPLLAVVALIERNEWSKVCEQLAPMRDALPATSPTLGLFYAIARHEDALSREGSPARDPANEGLARESLALLLDIGQDTAAARMLALRLLRRPWSAAPAPGARTSFFIVVFAIAVGALVGWLLDQGFDRFYHR